MRPAQPVTDPTGGELNLKTDLCSTRETATARRPSLNPWDLKNMCMTRLVHPSELLPQTSSKMRAMPARPGDGRERGGDSCAGVAGAPITTTWLLRAHRGAAGGKQVSTPSFTGEQAGASSPTVRNTDPLRPRFLLLTAHRSFTSCLADVPSPRTVSPRGAGLCLLHSQAPGTCKQFWFTGNGQQTTPEERGRVRCWAVTGIG